MSVSDSGIDRVQGFLLLQETRRRLKLFSTAKRSPAELRSCPKTLLFWVFIVGGASALLSILEIRPSAGFTMAVSVLLFFSCVYSVHKRIDALIKLMGDENLLRFDPGQMRKDTQ